MTKLWDFSAFPPCARPCMYNEAPLHCADRDFGCQCTNKDYISVWTTCITNTCLENEEIISWKVNVQGCRIMGYEVEGLMPEGFAGRSSPPHFPFASTQVFSHPRTSDILDVSEKSLPTRDLDSSRTSSRASNPSAPATSMQPFASTAPGQSAYTSTAERQPVSQSASKSLSTGAIAGIAVGAVLLLCLLIGMLVCIRRFRQQKDAESLDDYSWVPVSNESTRRGSPTIPGSRAGSAVGQSTSQSEKPAPLSSDPKSPRPNDMARSSTDRSQMRHNHFYQQRSEMPLSKKDNL